MPHPEGYRKALRLMKLAEKFQIPVITFIDTPARGRASAPRSAGRARRSRAT
jgi:acetyl-CoA carboxylase carboxyl transferase subunit alpha